MTISFSEKRLTNSSEKKYVMIESIPLNPQNHNSLDRFIIPTTIKTNKTIKKGKKRPLGSHIGKLSYQETLIHAP